MSGARRYHPFFALSFMRKTLLLYLVPLVQVLFDRDWEALWTALWQDLALFCLLAAVSLVMLRASSWELDDGGTLHLRWSLLIPQERTIQGSRLAAVQIERPLAYRLAGASRITLYPALLPRARAVTLRLTRRDALALADILMPAPREEEYCPAGGERVALVLLSANSLSTLLLVYLALRQQPDYRSAAEQFAYEQLGQAAAWAARWLPAGLAWTLVLLVFLFGLSLLRSFGHTVFYSVWRGGGVLASRGGLIARVERRFRLDRLSYAEVRLSPVPRLLRCYPVYLTAGCCCLDAPLFVYRAGQEALLERLLPGFCMPPERPVDITRRSLAMVAPAGGSMSFCLLLILVASWALPDAVPLLVLPAAVCGFWLLCSLEGYFREDACLSGGHLTFRRQKRLSLHCVCVFSPAAALVVSQSPWAVAAGRANLRLAFPGRLHETVRSIPLADALACTSYIERKPPNDKDDTV